MKKKMKKKNKLITALALLVIVTISLAVIGCEEEPEPHESTINVLNRDITVKGDASISAADFNNAKIKLQMAMAASTTDMPEDARDNFINMLSRAGFAIMITKGSNGPEASGDKKTMLIGVRYLIDNDVEPIALAIIKKVDIEKAFAD
jgi:hypothetical protein